jgi:hypothetical protein
MLFQFADQVLLNDVRIPLSCRDRGVAEKLLDYSDVHTVSQQQRGDGVAQHVWGYMSFNTSVSPELSNDVRHALS